MTAAGAKRAGFSGGRDGFEARVTAQIGTKSATNTNAVVPCCEQTALRIPTPLAMFFCSAPLAQLAEQLTLNQ